MEDEGASGNRWLETDAPRGIEYDERFRRLAAQGHDVHGEAALVGALGLHTVLDAGCGTGRVAVELASRGMEVVGVDFDVRMLESARDKAPEVRWVEGDLAHVNLDRTFDGIVMAGNVMIFVTPGTEAMVLANMSRHLEPGGVLVAGFSLVNGGLTIDTYDALASNAGLERAERYATWDRQPFTAGGGYGVSIHRKR
jgi:ubiquinone/menaquinone biosynthesis C-methylase UbiE